MSVEISLDRLEGFLYRCLRSLSTFFWDGTFKFNLFESADILSAWTSSIAGFTSATTYFLLCAGALVVADFNLISFSRAS